MSEIQNGQAPQVEQTQQLQVVKETPTEISFGNSKEFEHSQRVAKMLTAASLIPKEYQGSIPNTMIALEMAARIGASPLMVMQNLYIVHGKPGWSGSFVIATINASKRFAHGLRFKMEGQGDSLSCYAWTTDKHNNEVLKGTTVTMAMAKAEGWSGKPGSKWLSMPEQMIQYRAGAFFGRLYTPDLLMGMQTVEEIEDFTVLANDGLERQIESLLNTSNYNEAQVRGVQWKVAQGLSQDDAYKIISDLRNNQLNPLTEGLPHGGAQASDIKRQVQQQIK